MLHFLGTASANLGKEREALAHWREALLLDPASFRLQDYMDAVRQGRRKLAPAYRFPSDSRFMAMLLLVQLG